MKNYNTSDNLEDLDFQEELNSYNSVAYASDRSQTWPDWVEKNTDFYILLLNLSELEKIKELLLECGYTAWVNLDGKLFAINF